MRTRGPNKARDGGGAAGFTLLELLVVIAVISLLLALALPVLGRARTRAQRLKCSGNLRSLALAWASYLDNNDERFYQGVNANVAFGGWRGLGGWWPRPLNREVFAADVNNVTEQSARVFCCPADRGGIPGSLRFQKAYRVNGNSYQTNLFVVGPDNFSPFSPPTTTPLDEKIAARLPQLRRTSVTSPADKLLLLGDYGWVNQWDPQVSPRWTVAKELAEWHGQPDCHNVVFLDGHVEYRYLRKGYYLTDDYTVLPFKDLFPLARKVQESLQ